MAFSDAPRRKDLAFMVALIALFAAAAFACLGVAAVLDRWDSHRTIAGLQATQAESTEITSCIRLYAIGRDETRDARETALADAIVAAVKGESPAPALAVYGTANVAAKTASAAYAAYVQFPVLPCPISG